MESIIPLESELLYKGKKRTNVSRYGSVFPGTDSTLEKIIDKIGPKKILEQDNEFILDPKESQDLIAEMIGILKRTNVFQENGMVDVGSVMLAVDAMDTFYRGLNILEKYAHEWRDQKRAALAKKIVRPQKETLLAFLQMGANNDREAYKHFFTAKQYVQSQLPNEPAIILQQKNALPLLSQPSAVFDRVIENFVDYLDSKYGHDTKYIGEEVTNISHHDSLSTKLAEAVEREDFRTAVSIQKIIEQNLENMGQIKDPFVEYFAQQFAINLLPFEGVIGRNTKNGFEYQTPQGLIGASVDSFGTRKLIYDKVDNFKKLLGFANSDEFSTMFGRFSVKYVPIDISLDKLA